MCGACGIAVVDWSVPLVSGPRRRTEVGRFVTGVCRGVRVGWFGGGWTAAGPTGATRVAPTLDALLDHVAGRLAPGSWAELVDALADDRDESEAPHDDYLPPMAPEPGLAATTVLTVPRHGGLHLWLAAFGLGVRAFDPRPVALEAVHRRAPLRLLAANGRILGCAAPGRR